MYRGIVAFSNICHFLIDSDVFERVCTSDEPVDLELFSELFDVDRKVGFLESFFTPHKLKATCTAMKRVMETSELTKEVVLDRADDASLGLVIQAITIYRYQK